jgi:hypothetical protein
MTSKPHCDAASTIPGDDPPSIADVFGPKPGDTSWTKTFGLDTYGGANTLADITGNAIRPDIFGPSMTALLDAVSPKPGDTSWTKMLGLDTYGGANTLADITGNAIGPDIFGPTMTALLDAVSPKPGQGTSWMTAMGLDTYGPGMTALANAFGPKPGDAPWAKMLGLDTTSPGMTALMNAVSPKPGDTSWTKMLGLDTYGGANILADITGNAIGPDIFGSEMSALADAFGPKSGDTSWTKMLGLDTTSPGMTALMNAVSPKPGDTSWTKALGLDTAGITSMLADISRNPIGPDIFGPTMTALLDAVGIEGLGENCAQFRSLRGLVDAPSPITLAEELSLSHEIGDVPVLSVSSELVEVDPDLPVSGGLDSGELAGDIVEWLGSGEDYVAVVMVMAVVAVSVFLHEQGLDWAVAIVGAISTLLIPRRDAH